MDAINHFDLWKICRVCLEKCESMNDLNNVFEGSQQTLMEMLLSCSSVSNGFTGMSYVPHQICFKCTPQLLDAYTFKTKCEENDKVLADYLTKLYEIEVKTELLDYDIKEDPLQDPIQAEAEFLDAFEANSPSEGFQINDNVSTCSDRDADKDLFDPSICHSDDQTKSQLNAISCEREKQSKIEISENLDKKSSKVQIQFSEEIERDATNRFQCPVCQQYYNHKKSLTRHMNKTHGTTISNRCKVCGKVFAKGILLAKHMDDHSDIETCVCSICEAEFETESELLQHRKIHYSVKKPKSDSQNDRKVPVISCHPNGQKKIFCKICAVQLPTIAALRSHLEEHKSLTGLERFDKELLENLSLSVGLSHKKQVKQITALLEQGTNSNFYSITTFYGNELSLSDSETDIEDSLNPPRSYKCEICDSSFDRRYEIVRHQKYDHAVDDLAYQCTTCSIKFLSAELLSKHEKSQCLNDNKQNSCTDCGLKFTWKENLHAHRNLHRLAKANKFVCPICSKILSRSVHLERHALIHLRNPLTQSQKKFSCSVCKKKFVSSENLAKHKSVHLSNDADKFECEICHKKYNRRDTMRIHLKTHAPKRNNDDNGPAHLCVYCGHGFNASSSLIVHMRRHTGEKPYKCDFCDKRFPRAFDLSRHRQTHTGEKPHACTTCGKSFSRLTVLVRHKRTHTGQKPYKCTFCNRAFAQSNDLTLHIRRHTGDKPYICGICGERFIQGTALKNHRRAYEHYENETTGALVASKSMNSPSRNDSSNRVASPVTNRAELTYKLRRTGSRKKPQPS